MPARIGNVAGGKWRVANGGHRSLVTDHTLLFTLGLLLAGLGTGCRVVHTAVDVPGQTVRAVTPDKKDRHIVDPVEVQQTLLRFADEYSMRMFSGVENLRRGTNALSPAEVLQTKITLATETWSIASGPNAVTGLLDMTVFVTVLRMALEDYWQPRVFGETAHPMLKYSRTAETEIWQLVGKILSLEQQTELRRAIEAWHRENPLPESIVATRALGFASRVIATSEDKKAKSESVFGLLQLDPLSGLDPATREIAQTRLFAERALYVTQKMPTLLRWQTELLSVNAVEMPAVRQLVNNSTQIAVSVDRFAAFAEKLPGQLSTEREEILKALESQERTLAPLVNEVRQTLVAGSQMSTSLNTTLTSFHALMRRFRVGETDDASPPRMNAQPFRIQDYTATAVQLEATARRMTELLLTLDQTIGSNNLARLSAQVGPVVQQAQTGGKEIVDYAFWKGILLVVVALAAALIYRFLTARLTSTARSEPNSP